MADRIETYRSKPISLSAALLRDRSNTIRLLLCDLDEYVRKNPGPEFAEARDPAWTDYRKIIRRLKEAGRSLEKALFRPDNPPSQELAIALKELPPKAELNIYCSDQDVSLPFGFIFSGSNTYTHVNGQPSLNDFDDFWVNRFKITVSVEGGGCDSSNLNTDATHFRALYALHKSELVAAVPYLGNSRERLKKLLKIEARDHYNWESAGRAWQKIRDKNNVVFVFAHSDGNWLELDDDHIDCLSFYDLLSKNNTCYSTLLILNCCLSASGSEGASLLSVVARRGFCGLIGTEAEILNLYALACGTHLLWELCAGGKTLGQAFDNMQNEARLFPLNLFYTCYANRDFRLNTPISQLVEKVAA